MRKPNYWSEPELIRKPILRIEERIEEDGKGSFENFGGNKGSMYPKKPDCVWEPVECD
jgi:hypothetical protein